MELETYIDNKLVHYTIFCSVQSPKHTIWVSLYAEKLELYRDVVIRQG